MLTITGAGTSTRWRADAFATMVPVQEAKNAGLTTT